MAIIYNRNHNRCIQYDPNNSLEHLPDEMVQLGKEYIKDSQVGHYGDLCAIPYLGAKATVFYCFFIPLYMILIYNFLMGFILQDSSLSVGGKHWFITSLLIYGYTRFHAYIITRRNSKYIVFDRRNRILHCPHWRGPGYERIPYDDLLLLYLEKPPLRSTVPDAYLYILRPGENIYRQPDKIHLSVQAHGYSHGLLPKRFYNYIVEPAASNLVLYYISNIVHFMNWEFNPNRSEEFFGINKACKGIFSDFDPTKYTETDITMHMDEEGKWHKTTPEQSRAIREKLDAENIIPDEFKEPPLFDEQLYLKFYHQAKAKLEKKASLTAVDKEKARHEKRWANEQSE